VEEEPVPPLEIRLFGPLDARCHGAPLPNLRTRKGQWLLALLVLRAGREVERDWLSGQLWPESPESQTRANLRRSLTDLRQALGPEADRLHSPSARTLRLALEGAAVDVLAFDAALARGDADSLAEAVALYRGPLLEGCAEEWVIPERQQREQAYLAALERLASLALERRGLPAAEPFVRRAVTTDPLRESAHRLLMQTLAARGQYGQAVQVYRDLRLRLHQELNAEPDAETTALFQQLRAEGRAKADGVTGRGGDRGKSQSHRRPLPLSELSPSPRHPVTPSLPTGTLTFLFTDIEGSTRLWDQQPETMRPVLAQHDALLRQIIESHGGHVFKTVGDQFCAAFATALEALTAALAAQQALQAEPCLLPSPGRGQVAKGPPAGAVFAPRRVCGAGGGVGVGPLRVRMALHTGAAEERDEDYFGPALNRIARLLDIAHGGQILLSLATQELARDQLPGDASLRDLGEHRLRDLARPERIFQLLHPALPGDFPPLRSLDALPHNLPQQLTSFIGREQEMAEVRQRLTATRLLTLTGAGGAGKTRLSLQVAADLLEEYPDGVWLVELAPLSDPAFVPQAVATVLSVREEPGVPLAQTLFQSLKPKRLLLILDNCEHLLAACAQLADTLLRQCPQITLLATSREGLGIAGETLYRVPSLSLPDPRRLPKGAGDLLPSLTQYESVRLFIDRAVAVQPGFAVTNTNAPAVAEVCHRLDGIPLAIELAAARVRVLPVEQIADKLHDRFRLLTGGSRTALPRQQTLRALIDWSYDLLSEPERALLRRLSVFAGGWTLAAAEAVGAGEAVEAWEVLDLLTALVDKSLVLYEEQSGEARYHLLETVRQYAQDRLLETAESEGVRGRHLECFLNYAEKAVPELMGLDQVIWRERLEREHDNLRAALDWSRTGAATAETGLRLAVEVQRFWSFRGYLREGRQWLEGLLEQCPGAPAWLRAKGLLGLADLALDQGEYKAARRYARESLTLFRSEGDKEGTADALSLLAYLVRQQDDYRTARSYWTESLALYREIGSREALSVLRRLSQLARFEKDDDAVRRYDEQLVASLRELQAGTSAYAAAARLLLRTKEAEIQAGSTALRSLYEQAAAIRREWGNHPEIVGAIDQVAFLALHRGDYREAYSLYQETLAIAGVLGWRTGMGHTYMSRAAQGMGDLETAHSHAAESLRQAREVGNKVATARALHDVGRVTLKQGDLETAGLLLQESLALWWEVGWSWGIVETLEAVAYLALAQGKPERAAQLLGAAERLRETIGIALSPYERTDYEAGVTAARTALGEERFAAAWAEGRALPLERAIQVALDEVAID
jgi:predicted ATPase/class 3 adenylate cyclase/DNA-binding SARP family transcriptional activator